MTTRYVTLGDGKRIALVNYMKIVRCAKESHDEEFLRSFEAWWTVKGHDIIREFRRGIQRRINRHISGFGYGRKLDPEYQTELMRDCQNFRQWRQLRVRCYQLMTPELRHQFGHLLCERDEENI